MRLHFKRMIIKTTIERNKLRKYKKLISYITLLILLLIAYIGFSYFLSGPEETFVHVKKSIKRNISLEPLESEYIELPLFPSKLLPNWTLNVTLECLNQKNVSFLLMNHTLFNQWENGLVYKDIFQEANKLQLTFSSEDLGTNHYLVLYNKGNSTLAVNVTVRQISALRIFNFDTAFGWFEIAILATLAFSASKFS